VRLFVGEDLNFGLMLGSCIMPMPLLMTRSLSGRFWPKKSIMKLDHPPYSPDLALCDFLIFPKLMTALKDHRFSDFVDIQGYATTILQSIPEEEFHKCSEQWKHRLTKCIGAQGDTSKVAATIRV
jgi:hypothetical protein